MPANASQECETRTQQQTPGPFYSTNTPQTKTFSAQGYSDCEPILVIGSVLNQHCEPIAKCMLDFWHADPDGNYDNQGFGFRGHQYSDQHGNFSLHTCLPGLYPGRTRHIHVTLHPPSYQALTTQLYFPGQPANKRDGIYQESLLMLQEGDAEDGLSQFHFDFVLAG